MEIGILHYTSAPVVGGVESVILSHAQLFTKYGYSVTVISGRGNQEALPQGCNYINIPEIDSLYPDIVTMNQSLNQGLIPKNFDSLVQNIGQQLLASGVPNFDCLIVHNIFTKHFNLALTAALFHLLDRHEIRHCIAWCHDISWTSPNSRKWVFDRYPWNLIKTPRTDIAYILISEQRKRELTQLFNDSRIDMEVIYNGVDPLIIYGITPEITQIIEEYHLLEANPLIIMPVRITQAKNIEWAIGFTRSLVERNYSTHLVITGPPDPHDPDSRAYFSTLDNLRNGYLLQNRLTFLFQYHPESETQNAEMDQGTYNLKISGLYELLRLSDAVLLPSHREGFGIPILEAGLLNTPVIATPIPAAVEIGGNDIFTIDLSQDVDISAGRIMAWLEGNSSYRLKNKIKHNFSWDSIFKNSIEPLVVHQPHLES
jgi:glycosyltransferase involved in cell wall biosynthesis